MILQPSKKTASKTRDIQIACRISYEILAIQLGYLYCKFGGATLQHWRVTVHSIFQISISRNTKCAHKVGFRKFGHIYRRVQ